MRCVDKAYIVLLGLAVMDSGRIRIEELAAVDIGYCVESNVFAMVPVLQAKSTPQEAPWQGVVLLNARSRLEQQCPTSLCRRL